MIDDGSRDSSGIICDEYGYRDCRIKVYHTKNRGLSCARNLGLDEANGEWIGFVDSDDWIELDMYEKLLEAAEENEADVVECGVYREYSETIIEYKRQYRCMSSAEANRELVHQNIFDAVWNKLWAKSCFDRVRFPEGRIFEDILTTYRIFAGASHVCTIELIGYHYIYRSNSLSTVHGLKTLAEYWYAVRTRFQFFQVFEGEEQRDSLMFCARAAAIFWAYYDNYYEEERDVYNWVVREMNEFTKKKIPLFGLREWKWYLRLGIFFPHFNNAMSFFLASLAFRLYSILKGVKRISFRHYWG